MRDVVRQFAVDVAENFDIPEPVVEIGARPAEGQESLDLKTILGARDFIGCDIQSGPRVDRIEDIHALTFADNSVGTVIALDTLEHVRDPLRALAEVHRVLKPGGLVAISSVMFFVIHAHPWDYWRFTPEGFSLLLEEFESKLVVAQGYELMPESVFGVGIKGPTPDLTIDRLPRVKAAMEGWGRGSVDFGPIRMTVRQLWGQAFKYSAKAARRRAERLIGRS